MTTKQTKSILQVKKKNLHKIKFCNNGCSAKYGIGGKLWNAVAHQKLEPDPANVVWNSLKHIKPPYDITVISAADLISEGYAFYDKEAGTFTNALNFQICMKKFKGNDVVSGKIQTAMDEVNSHHCLSTNNHQGLRKTLFCCQVQRPSVQVANKCESATAEEIKEFKRHDIHIDRSLINEIKEEVANYAT